MPNGFLFSLSSFLKNNFKHFPPAFTICRTLFNISMMNIGITVYPSYGGSGIVSSELGRELALRGHTVHFISSSLPTRLVELSDKIQFHEVEMMSFPLFEQPHNSQAK